MSALVECVPNFSEGRDKSKVDAIVGAARAVPGVTILDVETDADHNRCVLSFVGEPQAALEACFQVAKKSRELIDLNHHKGEHPRMGAVDVIPFIPVRGVSIEECAALAGRLGARIGQELEIPVYLYDHAARVPERKDLANVRKGQFEGLKELIGKDPAKTPDFGPNRIHPTAGAVACGARYQIINFNLNLDISDMVAGKDIAKRIRASGGGLPAVRAKEIFLEKRNQVQISTVLTNFAVTPMQKVLAECMRLADEHKARIKTTEIVGLLPREALLGFAQDTLSLENFNPQVQILENRLEDVGAMAPTVDWRSAARVVCDALATTDATPGGGSGAGISAAMGCSLGQMAIGITLKSKKLDPARRPPLEEADSALRELRARFFELTDADAKAFDGFMAAMGLPKESPERAAKMQQALIHASEVPLATAAASALAFQVCVQARHLCASAVASDVNCALHLLMAAAHCAAENVRINTGAIKDAAKAADLERQLEEVLKRLNMGAPAGAA